MGRGGKDTFVELSSVVTARKCFWENKHIHPLQKKSENRILFPLLNLLFVSKKSHPYIGHLEFILSTSWTARRETKKKKKNAWDRKEECGRAWELQCRGAHQSILWLVLKQASTVGPLEYEQISPAIKLPIRGWLPEKKCVGLELQPKASAGPLSALHAFWLAVLFSDLCPYPVCCYRSFQ